MSIPKQYEGQLSSHAAKMFSRYPNEHGWDFLPIPNGKIDFVCTGCGRKTEINWEAREPCHCQKKVVKK